MTKKLMEVIKETVVEAIEPYAAAAGYQRVQRTEWRRSHGEVVTGLGLEMSKGSASERDFSLDWSVFVPGLVSLVYGEDEPAPSAMQWPAVRGSSQMADPALQSDWLRAKLPVSDEARMALAEQVRRHGKAVIRFLDRFETRRDVRIFLLESSGRDWLRVSQPTSPTRKLEVAAGLAALDGDEQDVARLLDELGESISGTPWDNAEGRRPLERIRAVMGGHTHAAG